MAAAEAAAVVVVVAAAGPAQVCRAPTTDDLVGGAELSRALCALGTAYQVVLRVLSMLLIC